MDGFIPFVNTFAAFLTTRAADPINSLIAYDHLNIKLCGAYSGLSDSYDGASHHASGDMAFLRTLPDFTILSVCDAVEAEKAVFAAAEINGPVYLRLSRAPLPVIYSEDCDFQIGKGVILREGTDAAIIATGSMVHKAIEASESLQKKGISVRVVDIHTVKPIDRDLILDCASVCGAIITAEEHSVCGGLGSAVVEVLSETNPVLVERIGLSAFSESGEYEQLLKREGLDAETICDE